MEKVGRGGEVNNESIVFTMVVSSIHTFYAKTTKRKEKKEEQAWHLFSIDSSE